MYALHEIFSIEGLLAAEGHCNEDNQGRPGPPLKEKGLSLIVSLLSATTGVSAFSAF
jgi:hypothetical protein